MSLVKFSVFAISVLAFSLLSGLYEIEAVAAPSPTPEGFQKIQFTYKGVDKRFFWSNENETGTWVEAQLKCVKAGTSLLTILSPEAQEAVNFAIEVYEIRAYSWISLHRSNAVAKWVWGDGTPLEFQNWWPVDSQANNSIGGAVVTGLGFGASQHGFWTSPNDTNAVRRYICE